MGKLGPVPALHNRISGYSGKTLVIEKCGTEHKQKNAPFHEKLAFLGGVGFPAGFLWAQK